MDFTDHFLKQLIKTNKELTDGPIGGTTTSTTVAIKDKEN